jgi:hypothetical protein
VNFNCQEISYRVTASLEGIKLQKAFIDPPFIHLPSSTSKLQQTLPSINFDSDYPSTIGRTDISERDIPSPPNIQFPTNQAFHIGTKNNNLTQAPERELGSRSTNNPKHRICETNSPPISPPNRSIFRQTRAWSF